MTHLAHAPGASLRARWLVSDSLALTRRNLEHVRQIPESLLDVTLQPIMFVLLFTYVFGGVIAVPGGDYADYLIGGILVQTVAFGMMGPGVSIASDLGDGMVDRIRSLPTSRAAYLLGHFLAEMAAGLLGIVILAVTGVVVGWSIDGGVLDAIAGFALLAAFSAAMICVGTLIGVLARSPDAVQGFVFMVVFPLTFLSNAFVPASSLPDGLQQVAEEPGERGRRGGAHAVRQPDGDPRRRAVAARAPDPDRRAVDHRAARGRRAAHDPALQAAHDRVTQASPIQ
jgi:ABC transporter DrrB family efflux protein